MDNTASYSELLKLKGLKNTKHRNSVLKVVELSEQPISAEQIYFNLKESNVSVNLSSIYRILETLVNKNIVIKTNLTVTNKALYEFNFQIHKHHLICSGCKKMLSIEGCPLEDYEKTLQEKSGFSITGHSLEIYGYCNDCKNNYKS